MARGRLVPRFAFVAAGVASALGSACGEDDFIPTQQVVVVPPASPPGSPPEDPELAREIMVRWIFGRAPLAATGPASVDHDVAWDLFEDALHVAQIDRLEHQLDYGVATTSHTFHPVTANGSLLIYQLGHQDETGAVDVVNFFTGRGYTVSLHAMPFMGINRGEVEVVLPEETITLHGRGLHDSMLGLDIHGYRSFQLFFQPIVDVMERYEGEFDQYAMAGLSGGGWTVDLYAAMDTRLAASYSIAGSMPFSLRERPDIGDFEQLRARDIYDFLEYEDLYFLAARGGRHRHIFNEFDNCCFAWHQREDDIRAYEDRVTADLSRDPVGGDFAVTLLPDRTTHEAHPEALMLIDSELAALRGDDG